MVLLEGVEERQLHVKAKTINIQLKIFVIFFFVFISNPPNWNVSLCGFSISDFHGIYKAIFRFDL